MNYSVGCHAGAVADDVAAAAGLAAAWLLTAVGESLQFPG